MPIEVKITDPNTAELNIVPEGNLDCQEGDGVKVVEIVETIQKQLQQDSDDGESHPNESNQTKNID